jgi:hypothetical protein
VKRGKTKSSHNFIASLRAARLRKRAQAGRCEGRKPYGHREGEQQILERMRELRVEGLAYGAIADRMNREKFPTRAGVRWYAGVVWRILQRH